MPTPHSYFKSELILKTVTKIMKLDDMVYLVLFLVSTSIFILYIATNVQLNTQSPV